MPTFLKEGIIPRSYQSAIASSALSKGNTLVVLPTGMGKTLVAFLVMEQKLAEGRVCFLAPTKPLVQQHCRTFLSMANFPEDGVALITGEVSPKNRALLWERRVCFSTPQSFQNDMKAGRASPSCSLCVVDEAHRAVGNYAYTFVAEKCGAAGALLLGLTASPGGNKARIEEIVAALGIKNIEIRTSTDSDVAPYMKKLDISYVRVPLGKEFSEVRKLLQAMLDDSVLYLANYGFAAPTKSKRGLVELRQRIIQASDRVKYQAISYYSTIFNLVHMLELLETQGLATFLSYVERMKAKPGTKARQRIFSDRRFIEALKLCSVASEHPKMSELVGLLKAKRGEKVLVFAQYRDQVQAIVSTLRQSGFSAERFVGKKEGVSADEQKRTIERFSKGEFSVMVATSIGEEGLDIPSVDTVVFFEPIPSEIRTIQRRGRAGRLSAGSVVVLITTGTRDEAYFYSSKRREENMRKIVGRLQRGFASAPQANRKQPRGEAGDALQKGTAIGAIPRVPSEKAQSAPAAPRAPKSRKKAIQQRLIDF